MNNQRVIKYRAWGQFEIATGKKVEKTHSIYLKNKKGSTQATSKALVSEYKKVGKMLYGFTMESYCRERGDWQNGDYELISHEHNPIWMEFTGLQDSKGTDIYEGDIVEIKGFGDGYDGKWEVSLQNNEIRVGWELKGIENDVWYWDEGKVIGNIYETPELLNK